MLCMGVSGTCHTIFRTIQSELTKLRSENPPGEGEKPGLSVKNRPSEGVHAVTATQVASPECRKIGAGGWKSLVCILLDPKSQYSELYHIPQHRFPDLCKKKFPPEKSYFTGGIITPLIILSRQIQRLRAIRPIGVK